MLKMDLKHIILGKQATRFTGIAFMNDPTQCKTSLPGIIIVGLLKFTFFTM